jgi:hypothetical protein
VAEEAARLWLLGCSDDERGCVPRRARESWLRLMNTVLWLRRPNRFALIPQPFGASPGALLLREDPRDPEFVPGSVATRMLGGDTHPDGLLGSVGINSHYQEMRAGRHYVQISTSLSSTLSPAERTGIQFGIQTWKPIPGQKLKQWFCCHYHSVDGLCTTHTLQPNNFIASTMAHWEGMQGADEDGDRIGLLLDIDQGSLTVYKNDQRLGVMATGLCNTPTLTYHWVVQFDGVGDTIRVKTKPAPASPTAEEVARAAAYAASDGCYSSRTRYCHVRDRPSRTRAGAVFRAAEGSGYVQVREL